MLIVVLAAASASYQNTQETQNYEDPNNNTVFVGGLDRNVTDDHLKQVFSQYGQLVHVKILVGKRCRFVQFAESNLSKTSQSKILAERRKEWVGSRPKSITNA
ncbi:polyadenylate-binding protein RBP45 [Tanacetum coccineum]